MNTDADGETVQDPLTQLSASGLAFRRGTPPDAVYTFKHSLVLILFYSVLPITIGLVLSRPAISPIPSNLAWAHNPKVPVYAYDPAKAAALLDEAGYPKAANGNDALQNSQAENMLTQGVDVLLVAPQRVLRLAQTRW